MRSILVIRLSSMGDVILATPLIRELRRTYPGAIIDVAVDSRFAEVWTYNPHIRRVWELEIRSTSDSHVDDVKLAIKESMGGAQYDVVVDLQKSLRSRLLRKGLGNSIKSIDKHRLEKILMVWLKKFPVRVDHIVSRYRSAADDVRIHPDHEGTEIWLEHEKLQGYYGPEGKKGIGPQRRNTARVAIAPGAAHATKRLPLETLAAVCKALAAQGILPVLLGGPNDVVLCNELEALAGVGVERRDNATSILDTAAVLDTCDAILTMDSGVMHIASARRVPVVAVFGGTVPELGFSPYQVPHRIVQVDVACRPCSHIGKSTCPRGHFLCMKSIESSTILDAIESLIGR